MFGSFLCGLFFEIYCWRAPSGRALRSKSSPFVPHGSGLSTPIPHAKAVSANATSFIDL